MTGGQKGPLSAEAIEAALVGFLKGKALHKLGSDGIGRDELLFEKGILDSLGMLETLTFLEDQFGVSFGAEDLTWEKLSTVRRIADTVARRKAGATGR